MPVFDSGPDDVRIDAPSRSPAAQAAAAADMRPLPPAIPLDAIGFEGDWPALAAGLPLTGISHQLAFNSELTGLDGDTLKLSKSVRRAGRPRLSMLPSRPSASGRLSGKSAPIRSCSR